MKKNIKEKEYIKYIKEMAEHIKLSMCVDGKVEFYDMIDTHTVTKLKHLQGAIFKCTDATRGIFYISWMKETQ